MPGEKSRKTVSRPACVASDCDAACSRASAAGSSAERPASCCTTAASSSLDAEHLTLSQRERESIATKKRGENLLPLPPRGAWAEGPFFHEGRTRNAKLSHRA